MRSFEQYDEICEYFAERKQKDNNTNEVQKHLQLGNCHFLPPGGGGVVVVVESGGDHMKIFPSKGGS